MHFTQKSRPALLAQAVDGRSIPHHGDDVILGGEGAAHFPASFVQAAIPTSKTTCKSKQHNRTKTRLKTGVFKPKEVSSRRKLPIVCYGFRSESESQEFKQFHMHASLRPCDAKGAHA
jgi:hypothetical protein